MTSGLQNVLDGNGLEIALYGMGLVFLALILLTLFVSALPRLAGMLERLRPLKAETGGAATVSLAPATGGDDRALVAALVAAAVHEDPAIVVRAGHREQ